MVYLLRKHLNLFINIRPIFTFNTLLDFSSIKSEFINDLDIVIIRELIGDVYFGEPRGFKDVNGERVGYNTMLYSESEVQKLQNLQLIFHLKEKSTLHPLIKLMFSSARNYGDKLLIE